MAWRRVAILTFSFAALSEAPVGNMVVLLKRMSTRCWEQQGHIVTFGAYCTPSAHRNESGSGSSQERLSHESKAYCLARATASSPRGI